MPDAPDPTQRRDIQMQQAVPLRPLRALHRDGRLASGWESPKRLTPRQSDLNGTSATLQAFRSK